MPIPKLVPFGCIVAALASLVALACTDSTAVEEPALLSVVSSADSLLSNNVASVVITVVLPRSLPQDAEVVFTTSLGRFTNPGAAPDRKITVPAHQGAAEARLSAAGDVGTAFVSVAAAGSMAQVAVEFTPALPEFIDLFVDRTAAPADGATPVTATAVLRRAAGAVSRGLPVAFQARDSATQVPLAALSGVMVTDSSGTARIRLTSPVVSAIQIQAHAAAAASESRTVRFTPVPAPTPTP